MRTNALIERYLLVLFILCSCVPTFSQSVISKAKISVKEAKASPSADTVKSRPSLPVVHPNIGAAFRSDEITVKLVGRKQNYAPGVSATADHDINSPKSVNIHPSGEKYYVNSLEGGTTLVFDFQTNRKLKVIRHRFTAADSSLWAPESGLFKFTHYGRNLRTFMGKPVESTFSHDGRYLWVPYYRRSFDINAQDPSAVAVIDTRSDSIVRMFETGPLPKMIATSDDNHYLAITHWGDNTLGLLDIHDSTPENWHYTSCLVVDYRLKLNYSLTSPVNRDVNSGYCLRGTVFTPDNKYLLVGCMGGTGGIAVIDLDSSRYLGRIMGSKSNLRHLVICNGYLYASINSAGFVQRVEMDKFIDIVQKLDGNKTKVATLTGWESCKVPAGARTIVLSPDGRYLFASCNTGSCLAVVNTEQMKLLGTVSADSYPVGLDISADGRYIFMTSQGRNERGGNAVDIFEVTYGNQKSKVEERSRPIVINVTDTAVQEPSVDTIIDTPEGKVSVETTPDTRTEDQSVDTNQKEPTPVGLSTGTTAEGSVIAPSELPTDEFQKGQADSKKRYRKSRKSPQQD